MPRITTSLIRKARAIDALLPALLAPCRELQAAQNELRWLREHVEKVAKARRAKGDTIAKASLLRQLVRERAAGKPLQYLLGTEYFGDLEIRCRPGVLIPRYSILRLRRDPCLTMRTEQIQPRQSHISPVSYGMRKVSLQKYAYLIFAPAPAVYPSSSTTRYPRRRIT
jgi:hypothetical protein